MLYLLLSLLYKFIGLGILLFLYYGVIVPVFGVDAFSDFINKYFFFLPAIIGGAIVIIELITQALSEFAGNINEAYNISGNRYERLVAKKLRRMFHTKPLRNVLIPLENGQTTETDMVFVTQQGVFCIECKYHWYYAPYWGRSIRDKEWLLGRKLVPNPFLQNAHHVKQMRGYLKDTNIPVYNIVASTVDLKDIEDVNGKKLSTEKENNYQCFFRDAAYFKIKRMTLCRMPDGIYKLPVVLNLTAVDRITDIIKALCGTKKQRAEHVERVLWNDVKRILPEVPIYFKKNKKTGKITYVNKDTGFKKIKTVFNKWKKKYVVLCLEYLSTEEIPYYSFKSREKKSREPYYRFVDKDIERYHIVLKDVYVTDYRVLSYQEAKKHPSFKEHLLIGQLFGNPDYELFICYTEQVKKAPDKYHAYLPVTCSGI